MKNQKGFIQIPLLVIVIVSIIVASVGTGVVLQKQEKLAPFIANISEMFKDTEDTTIVEEEAVKSEEPQVGQEPEPKEEEIIQEAKKAETQTEEAQIRAIQAELEAENLKQQAETAKEEVEKTRLLAEAKEAKAEAEKAKLEAEEAKAEAKRLRKEAEEAERLIKEKPLEISPCEGIKCPSCQYCIEGKCINRPNGYNDCGSGCQRCVNGSCRDYNATCSNCQYCRSDTCINYCEGTNTSCGCTNCANCNNLDGWVNMGVPYSCCDGDKACTCQKQEYRDYSCLGASCNSIVTNTRVNKNNCAECGFSEICSEGSCKKDYSDFVLNASVRKEFQEFGPYIYDFSSNDSRINVGCQIFFYEIHTYRTLVLKKFVIKQVGTASNDDYDTVAIGGAEVRKNNNIIIWEGNKQLPQSGNFGLHSVAELIPKRSGVTFQFACDNEIEILDTSNNKLVQITGDFPAYSRLYNIIETKSLSIKGSIVSRTPNTYLPNSKYGLLLFFNFYDEFGNQLNTDYTLRKLNLTIHNSKNNISAVSMYTSGGVEIPYHDVDQTENDFNFSMDFNQRIRNLEILLDVSANATVGSTIYITINEIQIDNIRGIPMIITNLPFSSQSRIVE